MGHPKLGTVDYFNRLRAVKVDEMQLEEIIKHRLALTIMKLENQVKLEEAEEVFFMPGPLVRNKFENQGENVRTIEHDEKPAVERPAALANLLDVTLVM